MRALYAAFEREFSEAYSPLGLNPEAGVEIEAFVLKASLPRLHAGPAGAWRAGLASRRGGDDRAPRGAVLGRGGLGADAGLRDGAPRAGRRSSPGRP